MTDQEKIDEIRVSYGDHNSSEEGCWSSITITCPACKQVSLDIEYNLEIGNEAASSDTLAECNNCSAKFDWAYIIEPEIIISQVK